MRQSDALAAVKRYNNLQLDGKPMSIELVGMNLVTPVVIPSTSRGILGNPVGPSQRYALSSPISLSYISHFV